ASAVIDFLEEVVVLANLRVVGLQRQRLVVRPAGLVQLPLVLVSDREIVVSLGVFRIELDGFFPAVDGFTPQAPLGDVDAEVNLRSCVGASVGVGRKSESGREQRNADDESEVHEEAVPL